jgi:hypothetical protein
MAARRKPLNSGRTMAVGVGVIGVVAVATILAIIFGEGGTGDGGTGTGSGTHTGTTVPSTQSLLPAQPKRPLVVTIRENNYEVNGRPVDLETLTDLASKVPSGDGPAVMVQRAPTSRAKAENDLFDALNKQGITFARD